jgi:omega-amidase
MPLTFTLIQTNLHWEDKDRNLQQLEEKINSIAGRTEIVVLPEMFSTGFSMRPEELAETMQGNTVAWMRRISSQKKIILAGSLMIKDEDHYYNRLIWMLPNGEYHHYDKRHCFGYGGEDLHYTPGKQRVIASVKGWKINLQVCYDLRFPVWARQSALDTGSGKPEYDVLLYVANWPERRNHAWKSLLVARAIENQCFVIGVNRVGDDCAGIYHSGDSMVVDPLGNVLHQFADSEEVFTVTLPEETLTEVRSRFPFWKDADPFIIANAKDLLP